MRCRLVLVLFLLLVMLGGAHAAPPDARSPAAAAPAAQEGGRDALPSPAASPSPESTPSPAAAPSSEAGPSPEAAPSPDAPPPPEAAPPEAAPSPEPSPSPQPSPTPRHVWSVEGDLRVLGESWDWFRPTGPYENAYSYLGARLRARLKYKNAGFSGLVELQDAQLVGLPTRAVAPAPQGQLGLGGSYFAAALRPSINTAGLRQALIRVGRSDGALFQVGRMEYASGMEAPMFDDILDWVKRARLKDRLIGTFDFSDYARTFDGARFDLDMPNDHFSGFVAHPTQGGFEPHFGTEISRINISDVAWTFKQGPRMLDTEAQLFWVHYDDARDVPFVDNRPIPLRGRVSAQGGIHIDTYGFHVVSRLGAQGDALAWYAHQSGKWGTLTQRADAFTLELGFRPKDAPLEPWIRGGYSVFSGDGNPADSTHGTFYAPLPTVRIYARFPFYNLMNLNDVYGQLLLVPWKGAFARFDAHALSLDSGADLWYTGSGATQAAGGVFGVAGRPAAGKRGLATLLDFSLEQKLDRNNTLTFYYGRASGGSVIRSIYPNGGNGSVIFLEYTVKLP